MRFSLEKDPTANIVTGLTADEIRLGDRRYRASIIVSPSTIIERWPVSPGETIGLEQLEPALALDPEILILGTGERLRFPQARIRAAVHARGVGLEIMDTGAACRTYNILALEQRRVVAALML